MASSRAAGVLLTIVLAAGSGCGTLANVGGRTLTLAGAPGETQVKPFGGVSRDLEIVAHSFTQVIEEPAFAVPVGVFFAADVPLSLVGDLLTLRQATTMARLDAERKQRPPPPPKDAPPTPP